MLVSYHLYTFLYRVWLQWYWDKQSSCLWYTATTDSSTTGVQQLWGAGGAGGTWEEKEGGEREQVEQNTDEEKILFNEKD